MRMIIIAVAAILIIGGGAAGAFFYFSGSTAEASTGDQASEGHDSAKKDKHSKKGDGYGASVEFVELDPLTLPIVGMDGVSQTVSMVVALEVHDAGASIQVKGMKPKLTDAYIQDMYGVLNEHAALKGGVIQVDMIKKRLSRITNTVMGDDVVHDVLLQVVQQRPI